MSLASPRFPARTCTSPHLQRGPPCRARLIDAKAGTVAAAIPPAVVVVFLALPRPSGDAPRPGSAARPCRSPLRSLPPPSSLQECPPELQENVPVLPSKPRLSSHISASTDYFFVRWGSAPPGPAQRGAPGSGENRGASRRLLKCSMMGGTLPKVECAEEGPCFPAALPLPSTEGTDGASSFGMLLQHAWSIVITLMNPVP